MRVALEPLALSQNRRMSRLDRKRAGASKDGSKLQCSRNHFHGWRFTPRPPARGKAKPARRPEAPRKSSGRCLSGTSPISIAAPMRRRSRPIYRPPSAPPRRCSNYAGKLAALADGGKGGKALAKAVRDYEALSDRMGRIVSLCEPALRRRHVRSGAAEILRRHPGEDHHHLLQAPVLPARAQPARRQSARSRHGRPASSGTTGLGLRICARRSPISSRTGSSSCSMRRPSPGAARGTGCSARP